MGLLVTGSQLAQPTYDLSGYPVDAVAYLDEHGQVGPGATTRIAAPDTVGNYMEGLFGADASVFIDDRLDMYPTQVVHDELVLYHGDPGWADVLDRWGITTVVWPRDKSLTALLTQSPAWRLEYSDSGWVVFQRT